MKEIRVKPVVSIYLSGLVWAVYALLFPLYRWTDLIVVSVISAAVYFIAGRFLPGNTVLSPEADTFKKTGDADKDALLNQGKQYLNRICQLIPSIDDETFKSHVNMLAERGGRMFGFISKNPADVRQSKNFITYYFPTAIKLIESYIEFTAHSGGKLKDTAAKIDGVMLSVVAAFDKHLETLYADKALDVDTDIEVLKGMLRAAGLDGPELKGGTAP